MSNTYTPGPWNYDGEIVYSGTYTLQERWKKHTNIAVMDDAPNWEANAHLIAAAPELLEAAEFLLNTTRMITENDNIIKGARTMLIKALNKARGF